MGPRTVARSRRFPLASGGLPLPFTLQVVCLSIWLDTESLRRATGLTGVVSAWGAYALQSLMVSAAVFTCLLGVDPVIAVSLAEELGFAVSSCGASIQPIFSSNPARHAALHRCVFVGFRRDAGRKLSGGGNAAGIV